MLQLKTQDWTVCKCLLSSHICRIDMILAWFWLHMVARRNLYALVKASNSDPMTLGHVGSPTVTPLMMRTQIYRWALRWNGEFFPVRSRVWGETVGLWEGWRCWKILREFFFESETNPKPSMYGIFTYIWLIFMVNVDKYSIHGWYGNWSNVDKVDTFFCCQLNLCSHNLWLILSNQVDLRKMIGSYFEPSFGFSH